MFEQHTTEKLGLQYDPMKTITHIPDEDADEVSDYIMTRDRLSRSSTGERRSRAASVADGNGPWWSDFRHFLITLLLIINSISCPERQSRVVSISKERPSYITEEDTSMQKISFSLVNCHIYLCLYLSHTLLIFC